MSASFSTAKPLIFNVHKPQGWSSAQVVGHFKRHLPKSLNKLGHFGTLDPFAEGVLMLAAAGASRLNDLVHELLPKEYVAEGILGIQTPTGDRSSVEHPERIIDADLNQALGKLQGQALMDLNHQLQQKFVGEYWQAPPSFSAAKHEGKALYEWAREGIQIQKPPVKRFIHELELLWFEPPRLCFRAVVSSGTYIRVLFEDMARELGSIGYLDQLKRTAVGHVRWEQSAREAQWPKRDESLDEAASWVMTPQQLLPFATITLDALREKQYLSGRWPGLTDAGVECVGSSNSPAAHFYWVQNCQGELIGLGQLENQQLKVQFNFPRS